PSPIAPLSLHDALPISDRRTQLVRSDADELGLHARHLPQAMDIVALPAPHVVEAGRQLADLVVCVGAEREVIVAALHLLRAANQDRKSTRLNSSHVSIS